MTGRLSIPLPSLSDWLFSAKTFAAAMLALYIGLVIDLPRPYWAVATVYIVSHPLTGSLRSKAVYRVLGTALGAVATVVMIPNLVTAPEVLSLAMALWTGVCLYFALLDRTPRSYTFMLAGYTAALIGFPAVNDPGSMFETALARVEEITLGIVCATVVGSLVFPRPIGPVLAARIDAWMRDARQWMLDALAGRPADATAADRRRMAADAVEINMLASHLAYDASLWQGTSRWVRALQQRMVLLLPILSAVGDRVAALRRDGRDLPPGLHLLFDDIAAWSGAGWQTPRGQADRLREAIDRLKPPVDARIDWTGILLTSLLARLREMVDVRQDCRDIRRHMAAGGGPLPPGLRLAVETPRRVHLHRDRGMALLSVFAAVLTVLACCAIWIATGWTDGAAAAQMGAVACCFFAAQDDPVPAILSFLYSNALAVLVAAVYSFAILPAITGFPMLVLVLAPTFLVIGLAMTRPAHSGRAMAVAATAPTVMALQSTYGADAAAFLNGGIALLFGMAVAAVVTRMVRSVGAEWSAQRLLHACWRDLAEAASAGSTPDRERLTGRMLDRLGILVPRLAAVAPGADIAAADALTDLRVGLNIIDLQRFRPGLPDPAAEAVGALLAALARFFGGRVAGTAEIAPPAALLDRIDGALTGVTAVAPDPDTRATLLALAGIRRALFPEAPPYEPRPDWRIAA